MPEPISLTPVSGAYPALNADAGDGTALSAEAASIRRSVFAVRESVEQSIELFGVNAEAISEVFAVAAEHGETDWNGEGAEPISMFAVDRAVAFIRALPGNFPMPEVAAEPDGAISLDWIHSRKRILSISVGVSDRLALAWLDGTDQGHAVVRFDGERIPQLILERIREATGHAAVRAA